MGKAKRKKRPATEQRFGPTPEQLGHGRYDSVTVRTERAAAVAFRRIAMIDTLKDQGVLSDTEHKALAYYRDQAQMAERSPLKSCLDQSKGSGDTLALPAAITSAIIATARIERDMGQLADIARAIAVDDKSISQWCIDKHGGRERYNSAGKFVAMVPIAEKRVIDIARLELKMAAHRIVA